MPEQTSKEIRHFSQSQQRDVSYMSSNSSSSLPRPHPEPVLPSDTYGCHNKESSIQSPDQSKDHGLKYYNTKSVLNLRQFCKNIDSGTDADDEDVKKGFLVPQLHHIRSRNAKKYPQSKSSENLSRMTDNSTIKDYQSMIQRCKMPKTSQKLEIKRDFFQKQKLELIRRITELCLMILMGVLVCTDPEVRSLLGFWKKELLYQSFVTLGLSIFYLFWTSNIFESSLDVGPKFFVIHTICENASLLYPPCILILVSLVHFKKKPYEFMSTIVLGVASIPNCLVPSFNRSENLESAHWMISLAPLIFKKIFFKNDFLFPQNHWLDFEIMALLYPLHQSLCSTLASITTTSLLPAELQLLSLSLINLLLHSNSPQAIVLNSLLWGGGVGILVSCVWTLQTIQVFFKTPKLCLKYNNHPPATDEKSYEMFTGRSRKQKTGNTYLPIKPALLTSKDGNYSTEVPKSSFIPKSRSKSLESQRMARDISFLQTFQEKPELSQRFSSLNGRKVSEYKRHRPQSSAKFSPGLDNQLMLNRREGEATSREQSISPVPIEEANFKIFLYFGCIYICISAIILVGITMYIESFALSGNEALGWVLGYLFGDIENFRLFVIAKSLERWVQLPPQHEILYDQPCSEGWVDFWRHSYVGEANTRLILCTYWIMIIILGLSVVIRLSSYFEVDTRRKIFHFMMVAILLPVTYIDPIFSAFALSLVLATFLLLEILRATHIPPFSKSLAYFLEPFIDRRDLKGPVVISHIFLLIGCSIPLWLSLSVVPRVGNTGRTAWEVSYREVSMVSGVICVGIGDAAASLIGRKLGHRKWPWTGGKTFEGSMAFAVAVGMGLVVSKAWLRTGGWLTNNNDSFFMTLLKSGVAACAASLAEATLTGGNDNVIVPIILWVCVKGLDI